MKKLGKKISFFTKIMLVIGLLISNLSSLSVVFAYEATNDVLINLDGDVLKINYFQELAEDVEAVNVKVYENYTYLNDLSEPEVFNVYSLTAEELLLAYQGELELSYNSMFANGDENVENFEVFDGTYSAMVELVAVNSVDSEEESQEVLESVEEIVTEPVELTSGTEEVEEVVLISATYEKVISHESGLSLRLFDLENNEISLVNGRYPVSVSNSAVNVVAQLKFGGLNPNEQFKYNGREYFAQDLVGYGFSQTVDFTGYLFGEYEVPVKVELLKEVSAEFVNEEVELVVEEENYDTVVYEENLKILYESYLDNAMLLNDSVSSQGYEDSYLFYGDSKDGILISLLGFEENDNDENISNKTALDIYNIVNNVYGSDEESRVTFTILKDGVDVLEGYDTNTGVTVSEYLSTVLLDESVVLVLSNEGLTVTYKLVNIGDLNNDTKLTKEDVAKIIDQVVGIEEITDLEESDVYGLDGKVNSLDVLYLNQLVETQSWDVSHNIIETDLNASLDVKFNNEVIGDENYLTSGDQFTVEYVLSLTDYDVNGVAGLFKYDKELFELVSVNTNYDWLGNSHDGKFFYLGDESLVGIELEQSESEIELVSEESDLDYVLANDYIVVSATFKALKANAGEVITLDDIELFNSDGTEIVCYSLDNDVISTDEIVVRASDNNKLSSLVVADQEIELLEDVYEYEITVSNEVTTVNVLTELENVAASITSIIYPEELVEGENSVVITVASESGLEQVYTVRVVREEAPKTTTQVSHNNYYGDYDNEEEEIVVTPPKTEEVVEEEKDSNLSRIIIIILILLVIAGLVYLIFKDDEDQETKKANKEVNKLMKEEKEAPVVEKKTKSAHKKVDSKTTTNSSKNKGAKSKKKER